MKSISRFLVMMLAAGLILGCDATVTDFVKEARPSNILPPGTITAPVSSSGSMLIRVSPGAVSATGGDMRVQATAAPTYQILTGGDIRAQLSLGRSRTTPQ